MHYYIDGYNLLFRCLPYDRELQDSREQIILQLNEKIQACQIDATIVFDAHFQIGDSQRSHYRALEILFTSEGETADEFIIQKIKESKTPSKETVVTSDKKLAWFIRRKNGSTQSVEEFLDWLNRAYKNKVKQQQKLNFPLPAIKKQKPILPQLISQHVDERSHYYELLFESKFMELMKNIEENKKSEEVVQKKKTKKSPKDRFQEEKTEEERYKSDMDRWLKVFEKNLQD